MNKSGRDALAETHDVLNGLRHFLIAVEESAQSDENAELRQIEKSLGNVVSEIDVITGPDFRSNAGDDPLFEPLQKRMTG
ncbi:hypothetical protein [Sulfitobacter geojensis]|jgi:hypothetical protein|uniref:hypothetical protein n=1 Tax=Sulfitobacter geojensis TaxID=1342299 RepID=UPI0036DE583A